MTQKEIVKQALSENERSIAELHELTGILRPNIRRILGEGAKAGEFTRLAKGVYTLTTDAGERIAWVECGDALQILPDLVAAGEKFDMIFLDPPYYSDALIGGNRMTKDLWYEFVKPRQFYRLMESIRHLVRTDESHVYLMLSNAKHTKRDMKPYVDACILNGFKVVAEGKYTRTFADGKPVSNARGLQSTPERLILLNKTGSAGQVQLDLTFKRPPVKGSYRTEKAAGLFRHLILQSTVMFDTILDCFAGSGAIGPVALELKRRIFMIDKNPVAISNFIIPRLNSHLTNL